MRILQAPEAKTRITAFLNKLKTSKQATVIRRNRPYPGCLRNEFGPGSLV